MVESDQSDGEAQDEMYSLELSDTVEPTEPTHKRPREETSEEENIILPAKKLCNSGEETTPEKRKTEPVTEMNGSKDNANEDKDVNSLPNEDNADSKPLSEDNTDTEAIKKVSKNLVEMEGKEETSNHSNGAATSDEDNTEKKESDTEKKDNMSKEAVEDDEEKSTSKKEEEEEEKRVDREEDDEKEEKKEKKEASAQKKKGGKSRKEDAEVVEGLELSVECASDKEGSTSSENEEEKEKKPKPKTIIVKAKPNDSEVEASPSEAEKSDSHDETEVVSPKQAAKRGRKRGPRTSFSKTKGTGSEESNEDVSDEDYSPRTKKRLKKAAASKKAAKTPTESKRGRGRGRRPAVKRVEKEVEEEEEEEEKEKEKEKTDVANDKPAEDNLSDSELSGSKSENESESAAKDGKRRRSSIKPDDDKRIQLLKKYIRTAGIHVKNYNEMWTGCKSNAARVRCLKELLEKHGITGRPSLEKCKKFKQRNETLKDIAELNTGNIISEGRVTRARRNIDTKKEPEKKQESPTKQREARNTFKRIRNVVDSDSE